MAWFAIDASRPGAAVSVEWPGGLGCQSDVGIVVGNQIQLMAPTGPYAVITFRNSKNAVIRYNDDGETRRLKKTKSVTFVGCE